MLQLYTYMIIYVYNDVSMVNSSQFTYNQLSQVGEHHKHLSATPDPLL